MVAFRKRRESAKEAGGGGRPEAAWGAAVRELGRGVEIGTANGVASQVLHGKRSDHHAKQG